MTISIPTATQTEFTTGIDDTIVVSPASVPAVVRDTEEAFTTALKTKLDGIEAGADVTDAANIAAAGAAMTANNLSDLGSADSALTNLGFGAAGKAIAADATAQDVLDYLSATSADVSYINTGAGAVSRTVQAWLRERPISVVDYGAVGDGGKNSANNTAFQAAIDVVLAAGGGSIYIPPGTYYFNEAGSELDPGAGNILFLGAGKHASILKFDEGTGTNQADPNAWSLFVNTTNSTKGLLGFEQLGLRGTWDTNKRNGGGTPFWLDYYSDVWIDSCHFEALSFVAMDFHFLGRFRATHNSYKDIARDVFRIRDTPNCIVLGNYGLRNGDDVVAIHTRDDISLWPTREGIVVAQNQFINSGVIKILGGRQIKVVDNWQDYPNVGGIQVGYDGTEGNLPIVGVQISGNTINNLVEVTSATPAATGNGIVVRQVPPRGVTSTNNTAPGRWDSTGDDFIYPWDHIDNDTSDATKAVAPMEGIEVSNNKLRRTCPTATNFSDYGFGSVLRLGVEYDPAITDADLRQSIGIYFIEGGLNSTHIHHNIVEHFVSSIAFGAPTSHHDYIDVVVDRNIFRDFTARGIYVVSGAYSTDIAIENNRIDGDIYRKASNSNNDGSYVANSTPNGVDVGAAKGVSIKQNQFSKVCNAINATSLDEQDIENNTLILSAPAALGFNTGNKGIGSVPNGGGRYRFKIVNSDPTDANHLQLGNNQLAESSATPSTGTYIVGTFVRDNGPSAADGRLGWLRVTTGSGHVLDTDWVEINPGTSGTYTPTLTSVANIDATALTWARYFRIRDTVTVIVSLSIDPTSGGSTTTTVGIDLPVASGFTVAADCGGIAQNNSTTQNATIAADTTNDRAQLSFPATNTANIGWIAMFTYEVK